MKHTRLLVFLVALAFAGCTAAGTGGGAHNPPTHASVAGATGLYVQSGGARSIRAVDTVSGDLMRVNTDTSTATVTWTDATGKDVTATITRAMPLSADAVMIAYTYDGGSGVGILDTTTGDLTSVISSPDNWDRAVILSGQCYFVSGGAVYKMDVVTGAESTLTPADGIPSDSYLFFSPNGGILTLSSAQKWFYPTSGPRADMSSESGSLALYTALSGGSSQALIDDSGLPYLVRVSNTGGVLEYSPVTVGDTAGVSVPPWQTLDAGPYTDATPNWYGSHAVTGAVMVDGSQQIVTFTAAGGALSATVAMTPSPVSSYVDWEKYDYVGSSLYCFGAAGNWFVGKVDMSDPTTPTGETLATTADEITGAAAAGGQVFFSTATATYQVDETTKAVSNYSSVPVSVESIK